MKGTSDYYCSVHAEEFFGDVAVLQSIEEQARELKSRLHQEIDDLEEIMEGIEIDQDVTGQESPKD